MHGIWTVPAFAAGLGLFAATSGLPNAAHIPADSYTISAPYQTILHQGESQQLQVSLTRGAAFRSNVRLQAVAPYGLHVSLSGTRLRPGDSDAVVLTVAADADARIGRRVITVAAMCDVDSPTSIPVNICVLPK